jgi:hypothetical protein
LQHKALPGGFPGFPNLGDIMQTLLEFIGGIAGFVILWAFLYFLLSF